MTQVDITHACALLVQIRMECVDDLVGLRFHTSILFSPRSIFLLYVSDSMRNIIIFAYQERVRKRTREMLLKIVTCQSETARWFIQKGQSLPQMERRKINDFELVIFLVAREKMIFEEKQSENRCRILMHWMCDRLIISSVSISASMFIHLLFDAFW